MSDWFYSTGGDHRAGPLSSEDLVSAWRQRRLGPDTLVWRDGMAQWRPLSEFAAELGLADVAGAPLPPPLPPRPAPVPASIHSAPPKKGMSGCMIALIVAGALLVPVLAMLAAIALPAYQDYTTRAQLMNALPPAEPLKRQVAEHLARSGECPTNDDQGFGAPDSYASGTLASITLGTFDSDKCGMELILAIPGKDALDGKAIWLEYDAAASTWQCTSEIDDRYLPSTCRG